MANLFTSDLHFLHKNIVSFTNRGKDTSQENHTEWLIELWNKQVKKSDSVYILGDVCFGTKYEQYTEIFNALNGGVFIIKGNHDRSKMLNSLKEDNLIQNWYEYKEIKIKDNSVCLFHYPISSWHKQGYGSWMLHGHCHGSFNPELGKILDVGLDSAYNHYNEHKFFTEDDIEKFMSSRKVHINDHHKDMTVVNQTEIKE